MWGPAEDWRIHAGRPEAHGLYWHLASDYVSPPHDWMPAFPMALAGQETLYFAARAAPCCSALRPTGPRGRTEGSPSMGLECSRRRRGTGADDHDRHADHRDAQGNAWFGFVAAGANPAGLSSGLARISLTGPGRWISAAAAAKDPAMTHVAMGCAPALSTDGRTIYVAVSNGASGSLVGLDAATLAPKYRSALLDPASGDGAWVSDDSSASPTIGPDGDVFFGVLENPFPSHNDRGWLLHFSADLTQIRTPGSFGWTRRLRSCRPRPYLLIRGARLRGARRICW